MALFLLLVKSFCISCNYINGTATNTEDQGDKTMQREFQNALEISKLRYQKNDDSAKIKELQEEGKFVVYHEELVHCTMTDAVFDSEMYIVEIFADYEAAEKFYSEKLDEYLGELGIACPQWYLDKNRIGLDACEDDLGLGPKADFDSGDIPF